MEKGREGQRQAQNFTKKHFMFLAAAKFFWMLIILTIV